MLTESTKSKRFVTVLFEHYLDIDFPKWERVNHKKIGDNLRCYPIIAAFGVAILYLWDVPYVVFGYNTLVAKIASVIWGIWLAWFALLTVFQTAWIFSSAFPDLINLVGQPQTKAARRAWLFIALLSSTAAGFFLIGTIQLAWVIFSHAAKFA
jgi:hypothetical protein